MPKISDLSSYGQDALITGDEYLIGTDVGGATKTFTLTSIAEYVESTLGVKQDLLVSGTNIKTINGASILGSGNLSISGGLGSSDQTINLVGTRSINLINSSILDVSISNTADFRISTEWADEFTEFPLMQIKNDSTGINFYGIPPNFNGTPTMASHLVHKSYVDSNFQPSLVSGTNIKTVNGTTLLGSGNLVISDDGLAAQNQVLTADREIDLDTNDLTFRIGTGGRLFVTPDSLGSASVHIDEDGEVLFANTGSTMAKVAGTATSGFDIVNYQTLDTLLFAKQATLVSGTNIKTINGSSILGSGDLTVAGSGSGTNSYVDSTGNGLVGTQNGTNDVFTVSQSSYLAGSLLVFVSGFPLSAGNGLTETTPASGVFTLDTPPESYDVIIVQYSN